ncbi:MAG: hypothetical protein AAGJ40_09800 [Planctomycetota bacterium]
MEITHERFAGVVGYLSTFANRHTPIMFTPVNDTQVIASVNEDGIYAEYAFEPSSALVQRFATRLDVLKQIAAVTDGGMVQYTHGSQAVFSLESMGGTRSTRSDWWIPFVDYTDFAGRPEFEHEGRIDWDGSFARWLQIAKQSTLSADSQGCLDCVLIDTRIVNSSEDASGNKKPQCKRFIVSTDRHVMQVYQDTVEDTGRKGSVLIEGRHVPKVVATCESGSRVEIRVGLNHFSVQCGRRSAVFNRRTGIFPKWREVYKQVMRDEPAGEVVVDRHYLGAAVRQAGVAGDAIRITTHDDGLTIASAFDDCRSAVDVEVPHYGSFGPITIRNSYLKQITSHWPADSLSIESRSSRQPIVVRSPQEKRFTSMYQLMEETSVNQSTETRSRADAACV